MDERSDISGPDRLQGEVVGLESDTVYRGMTVAPADEGSTFVNEYATTGTITEEDEPDLTVQRQRIERTRAQMGSTIDQIEQRLSPGHLADQAKTAVKDATLGTAQHMASEISGSASDLGSTIVETIRENPIPAALAGLGLGWLIMSMRSRGGSDYTRSDVYRYRYQGHDMYRSHDTGPGLADRAGEVAGSAADAAQETAGQVAGSVQSAAGQVAGTIQNAAGAAGDTLGQVGSQAQYGLYRAESQMERWMREKPLAVAVGAFAAGIATGLAIPETPVENQWLGEYRENLTDQAQQIAQVTAQKVGTVAQEAASAAKDAAQQSASEQGLPVPGDGNDGPVTEVEFTPARKSGSSSGSGGSQSSASTS